MVNSALSSTKDNSLNQFQKKKLFLNSDNNNNNNKTNSNIIATNKSNIVNNNYFQVSQKQKLTFPDKSTYDGYIKYNEFDGYGEYKCKTRIMSIKDENSLCRYCICKNAGFSFGF